MKKTLILMIFWFSIVPLVHGQIEDKQKIGIHALINSPHTDIALSYRISKFMIIGDFGYSSMESKSTEYVLGLSGRYYITENVVSPFVQIGILSLSYTQKKDRDLSIDEDNSISDTVIDFGFGGEYYFSPSFSIGIMGQINFAKSDSKSLRFGNPGGTTINTATLFFGTLYF